MQSFLFRVVAATGLLAPLPLAVQVHRPTGPSVVYGDTHFRNLIGARLSSRYGSNDIGHYDLLRMPKETKSPALLSLRGAFDVAWKGGCGGLYLKNLTIRGDWLDGRVVHFRWVDDWEIKVSSTKETPYAGPWKTLASHSVSDIEAEQLPDTIKITKTADGEGEALQLHVGPPSLLERPNILIARGDNHEGLDLFLSGVSKLVLPQQGESLVGQEPRSTAVEACDAVVRPEYMIHGDKHVWNLAGEGLSMSKPGDFPMLRMPMEKERPAILQVRGSFEEASAAPCGLRLTGFTMNGEWLGNKTLHVRADPSQKAFTFKASSSVPAYAGRWKPLDQFDTLKEGEALPYSVKLTATKDFSAFRLHLGPKILPRRPKVYVAQGHDTVSMFYIKKFEAPLGAQPQLIGTNSSEANCDSNRIVFREAFMRRMPALRILNKMG